MTATLLSLSLSHANTSVRTTISNVHPRLDNSSSPFDAHDGNMRSVTPS
jgi:hypothetical protein